ncbi:MAG: LLM class flavin-dependent oxidoreductase [Rhodospirillales bacterium]
MKVRFAVNISSGSIFPRRQDRAKLAELIRIIDSAGVDMISTYDSSFLGGDAYVRATLIAEHTENAMVGVHPTNPLTREPQIMGGFLGSLDALTEGRAFVGIGSGDSAVYNIGYKPATRARIEDYVTCMRDLWETGEATYAGRPQQARWGEALVRRQIPVMLCAEGPRMFHLAGRIADGVLSGAGVLPEVVENTLNLVRGGAEAEGRDPDEIPLWFTTRTSLDEDREKAQRAIYDSVASILNHSMRFGLENKSLPTQLVAKVQQFIDGYVLYEHQVQHGTNGKRMADIGLADYAMERYALAGTVGDWIDRIGVLAEAGATNLYISVERGDLDRQIHYMKVFAEQIRPRFA